jgi:hypothetical protein
MSERPTPPQPPSGGPPPGWYADPEQPGWERWWDGNLWSEHRRQAQTQAFVQPQQFVQNPTSTGAKFGLGLALGWFILFPMLLIGGCAALVAIGSNSEPDVPKADLVEPTASDLTFIASIAEKITLQRHPGATGTTTCTDLGKQTVDFTPDTWDYECNTKLSEGAGSRSIPRRISCFSPPPYSRVSDDCSETIE